MRNLIGAIARFGNDSTRISLFAVVVWAVLISSPVFAQDEKAADSPAAKKPAVAVSKDYKTIKVDESLKRSVSKLSQKLRGGFEAGDQALFDKVCDNYVLAMWTQPQNQHQLAALRGKFCSQLQSCKSSSATRQHFNSHLLDVLPKMAADNYHPAVRCNCMMLLGELDEKPSMRAGDTATPLPAALPILLKAASDEKQINAVKLAALLGVARHAWVLRDADSRRNVGQAMSTLATTKSVPGTSSGGQSWMRCIAIETLGRLGSAGEQGATAKMLLEIVDDATNPYRVRVAAARAVGNLAYPNANGLDPDAMVRQLGRLAMRACKTEIEECKKNDRTISPRKLKNRLIAARIGLTGNDDLREETAKGGAMSLVEKSDVKKNADKIREQIDRWIGMLDDKALMKKVEPPQDPTAPGMMGMGMMGPGMGRPGMGGGMEMMGMGGGGRGAGVRPGTAAADEEDDIKTISDDIIEKIKADLKTFAVLVQ